MPFLVREIYLDLNLGLFFFERGRPTSPPSAAIKGKAIKRSESGPDESLFAVRTRCMQNAAIVYIAPAASDARTLPPDALTAAIPAAKRLSVKTA